MPLPWYRCTFDGHYAVRVQDMTFPERDISKPIPLSEVPRTEDTWDVSAVWTQDLTFACMMPRVRLRGYELRSNITSPTSLQWLAPGPYVTSVWHTVAPYECVTGEDVFLRFLVFAFIVLVVFIYHYGIPDPVSNRSSTSEIQASSGGQN